MYVKGEGRIWPGVRNQLWPYDDTGPLKEPVTGISSSIYLIKDEGTVQQTPSTTCFLTQRDSFINCGELCCLGNKRGREGRASERDKTAKGDYCQALRSLEWLDRGVLQCS